MNYAALVARYALMRWNFMLASCDFRLARWRCFADRARCCGMCGLHVLRLRLASCSCGVSHWRLALINKGLSTAALASRRIPPFASLSHPLLHGETALLGFAGSCWALLGVKSSGYARPKGEICKLVKRICPALMHRSMRHRPMLLWRLTHRLPDWPLRLPRRLPLASTLPLRPGPQSRLAMSPRCVRISARVV